MDEQEFVQLLESLLLPDTERVKSATKTLNKSYYTQPQSVVALLRLLVSHPKQEVRQLAAVEARKLVPRHWSKVPQDQKPAIRNELLAKSLNEEVRIVRHATARVVCGIYKQDYETWTELPALLQAAAVESDVRHREVGVYITYLLLDSMGDMFSENLSGVFDLLRKTIQDPESIEVRINTMLALSRIAMLIDAEEDEQSVKQFQNCVPGMMMALKDAVISKAEHASQAFEVFHTFIAADGALLDAHFKDIVKFMMDLASQTEVDEDSRSQALGFLMQAARWKRLKIQSLRIGEELTLRSLQIVKELNDLASDDEDLTPARMALSLIDYLASSLPPSQVVVPLLRAIGPFVTSQDANERRAGLIALGQCVEGAPDFMSTQLKEIMPMVLSLLEDSDVKVREAALSCIARLADDLAEELGKYHEQLIPIMVRGFDVAFPALENGGDNAEAALRIIRSTCDAVDSLIEGLDKEDAAKYAPELVQRFSRLLEHDDYRTRCAAIGAVGSVASAAEEGFIPYFKPTMQALGKYVEAKESQEDLDLRCVVVDSMGKIAIAVGPEEFKPYVMPLMQSSEEALHLDHPHVRETSYILWGTMAKLYEEDFAPYLDGVANGLLESLNQEESSEDSAEEQDADGFSSQEVTIGGKKFLLSTGTNDDGEEDIIDLDPADEDWEDDFEAVTAIGMEKEIAIECVGDVLSYTKSKYLPHFEKTIQAVLKLAEHSYEGIRKAAIVTLWRAYAVVSGLAEHGGAEKWKAGLPLKVQPSEDIMKLGEMVMTATLSTWEEEDDRPTVTDINRILAATLKSCGPAPLVNTKGDNVVTQLIDGIIAILSKQHRCQLDLGDENADEDEIPQESSEYDWLIIETALDLMVALAAVIGPDFIALWKRLEKYVLKYASGQEGYERSATIGSIAECIAHMGEAVTPHTPAFMKILLHRVGDSDPEVKSNAVYGIGMLYEKSGDEGELLKNLGAISSKLEPLLDADQPARIADNSVGCLSRIIARFPDRLPLGEVLPVLVSLLPLREDYEENAPVYKTIVGLYKTQNEAMMALTEQMKPVLEKVLSPPEEQLNDETRAQLNELVQYLQKQ